MLYATGLTEADMSKAQVGIVSNWYEGNPCNMHLDKLAVRVKEGVVAAGLVGMRFSTIGVSDGMSMGTEGMSYSLQSRNLIADSIETVVEAQWYDALVALPGCDKNMPGCLMAMGRLNRPALMVYGGTIRAGHLDGADARYRLRVPVLWRIRRRKDSTTTRARADRAACVSRRRRLRRHVHGQHDGHGDRGPRHVAALQFLDAGRGSRQDGRMLSSRSGDPQSAGVGPQAARHHDPPGVRKRDGAGDGAGRLDQRRVAFAGDGSRRSKCRWNWPTFSGRATACPIWPI